MAGIEVKVKKLKNQKGIDYTTEIPFEKTVPQGRYDSEEKETPGVDLFKSNISLQ